MEAARRRLVETGLQELRPAVRPDRIGVWASLFALAAIAKLPLRWPPVWTAVFSVTNAFKLAPLMLVRSRWHERIVFACAVAVCTLLFTYGSP